MTDRPTPASDEKLLIFGWIATVLGTPKDFDTTKYNELTDKLYELHTAAVQAESRKLLEQLKAQEFEVHIGGHKFIKIEAVDAELARLDSEQQKLGGYGQIRSEG